MKKEPTKKQKELIKRIKRTYKRFIKTRNELLYLFNLAVKNKISVYRLAKELTIDKSAVWRRMKRSAKNKNQI